MGMVSRRGLQLACLLVYSSVAASEIPNFEQIPFSKLDFKAKKLMLTATASLEVSTVPQDEAQAVMVPFEGAFEPAEETLRLDVRSGFLGRDSLSQVWLLSSEARALQRIQLETGKRRRKKIYRFAPNEVLARRITPTDDQPKEQEPERWKNRWDERVPAMTQNVVIEPSALFLLVTSTPDSWLDEPRVVHTFSDNELHRVRITRQDTVELRTRFEDRQGDQGPRTVEGRRLAVLYKLEPLPRTDGSEGKMQLLGLEGAIELFVDAETRLPLQISGRIPPVGQVQIRLQSAVR